MNKMNKNKFLILILSILVLIVVIFISFNIKEDNVKQIKAEKLIQDETFVANENYQNVNKELILTNNNENFLINGEVVPDAIRVEKELI